jgi:hypothetical protein
VQNFFVTPIAVKIARAVSKLDKVQTGRDIEVMLVTVPSKQVDFFLLRSPKKTEVYLVMSSDKSTGLVEGRFYPEPRFRKMLASEPDTTGFGGSRFRGDSSSPEPKH